MCVRSSESPALYFGLVWFGTIDAASTLVPSATKKNLAFLLIYLQIRQRPYIYTETKKKEKREKHKTTSANLHYFSAAQA